MAVACTGTFLMSSSVAATAAPPEGGCPPGFDLGLLSLEQSADLVLANGFPGTSEQIIEGISRFDKNGDQQLCVQDFPNTKGTPAYVFNFVDNRLPA